MKQLSSWVGKVRDRSTTGNTGSVKRVTYHLSFSLELLKGVTEKHFWVFEAQKVLQIPLSV